MTDEQIIEKAMKMRSRVVMGNRDLFDRMAKSKRYVYRDQWDEAVRRYHEEKKKFTLQVPVIKPKIKQLVGMQLQNPKDINVEPNRGGSEVGAKIINKLAKHATDSEHVRFVKTQWFEAGNAANVGYIYVSIDRNEDPKHGNLKFEKLCDDECGIDPDCKIYDINSFYQGAKCFVWEPWVDKELVEVQYPEKVYELKNSGDSTMNVADVTGIWSWMWGATLNFVKNLSGRTMTPEEESVHENKYKLTHVWWRKPKNCVILYKKKGNELDSVTLVRDKQIKIAKGIAKAHPDDYEIENVIRNVMNHTVMKGDVLLENKEDELNGIGMFSVIPWSPYFDDGWRGGPAEDMVSTQDEINFIHSGKLNLLKKMINTRWKIAKDILGTMTAWLEKHGSDDNLILDKSKFGGEVEEVNETLNLGAFDKLEDNAIRNTHLISGVRSEDASYDSSNLSGKAVLAKQQMSMTGNSPIMLNFDYSQTILHNLVVDIIRRNQVYSMDEILEIVDEDEMIDGGLLDQARQKVIGELQSRGIELPQMPPEMNPEALNIDATYAQNYLADIEAVKKSMQIIDKLARPVAMDMLYEEISNLKRGKYNTTVTMSPYSPSMRMAEMEELAGVSEYLLKTGQPPIPGKRILEVTSLSNKDEIIREWESQQKPMAVAG